MGGLAHVYPPLLPPGLRRALVEPRGDALDGALAFARRSAAA
jgi:N-acetylglucosamine kinase-like BadF-type ATPase